jgi:ribosomal protein S20
MTNHHLSVEQKFHLEAAFREIDNCNDLEKLRALTKQIITAQENEKAFAREAMQQIRKEMETAAHKRFGFDWGQH